MEKINFISNKWLAYVNKMLHITNAGKKIVLKIAKDLVNVYNPSSISNNIGISRVGAFKILNSFEEHSLLIGKTLGKARFYELNWNDEYAIQNFKLLLMEESILYQRWRDEFSELNKYVETLILFGSMTKDEKKAKDIDILLVYHKKNNNKVNQILKKKNEILTKKIHPLKQTHEDFIKNIKKQDKVLIDAIKTGIVLSGFDQYIELIKKCHK